MYHPSPSPRMPEGAVVKAKGCLPGALLQTLRTMTQVQHCDQNTDAALCTADHNPRLPGVDRGEGRAPWPLSSVRPRGGSCVRAPGR